MHGNLLNKNKLKLFNTANSDLAARILILENNVYKVTYYEIISGASGTLTVPTAATINANEFSGANCILSEIDINNKPTWVSPKTAGGTVVTATLNTGTGAWVKSGVTVSANVALIYSINIAAKDYSNLTNFYIIDETVIGDFSYVLNNTTTGTVSSSLLANAMSDETGSGALVFGTSPTFTTDITTPLIIGGSAVGSTIQYKGTSGNGTSTVAAHQFLVGNNGATTAAQIFNSGQVSIGNYAGPTNLRILTIGQDTAVMSFGSLVGATGYAAIYMNQGTPSISNYSLATNSAVGMLFNDSFNLSLYFRINNTDRFVIDGAKTSGASTTFTFTTPANTGQTASTEIPVLKMNGATKTWSSGNITTQRWSYFTANTAAFASASTITNSYGLYVEAATAGSNATITNNWAAGFSGKVNIAIGGSTTTTNPQDLTISGIGSGGGILCDTQASNVAAAWRFARAGTEGIYLGYDSGSNNNIALINRLSGTLYFSTDNSARLTIGNAATSGAVNQFIYSPASTTGQTASTEINGYLYNSYSRQWATGAITTQREHYYKSVTYSFVGASTITNAYGAYFEAPTAGTNATITNNWAAGFSGNVTITGFLDSRIKKRVTTITSSATPTINTDNSDAVTITTLATNITSFTTNLSGTPNNFDELIIRIKDDGTARTLAWGASFEAKGVALPTTTVISKVLTVKFIYDSVTSKWGCVASSQEY